MIEEKKIADKTIQQLQDSVNALTRLVQSSSSSSSFRQGYNVLENGQPIQRFDLPKNRKDLQALEAYKTAIKNETEAWDLKPFSDHQTERRKDYNICSQMIVDRSSR